MRLLIIHAVTPLLYLMSNTLWADTDADNIARDQLRQAQQQQEALQQQLQHKRESVHLSVPQLDLPQRDSDEACFKLDKVSLEGDAELIEIPKVRAVLKRQQGACLGSQGIKALMDELQNVYISRGLVTTRVLAPAQDLRTKVLKLQLVAGKAGLISLTKEAEGKVSLSNTMPLGQGEYLDLRALEQALENLQRLSSVKASFSLKPAKEIGVSDIQVKWQQQKKWRVALSANDSGSDSTGKYQGNATLFLENPTGFSDLFYVSKGVDLHDDSASRSGNFSVHYSIPFGYWLLDLNSSKSDYKQTIAGLNGPISYTGNSANHSIGLSRIVYRSETAKTRLKSKLIKRDSQNFINGTQIEVQRRDTSYLELGVEHEQSFKLTAKQLKVNSALSYRRGTGWFGAQPAPEEATGDATARSEILRFSASAEMPFQWNKRQWRWNSRFESQWTDSKLTSQDKFTIGNRYTVRGFDGAVSLSADRGWYLQNELATRLGNTQTEAFASVDVGEVSGRGSEELLGTRLVGASVGVKGNYKGLSYQVFAGTPLYKPEGFQARETSVGFTLNWQF